MGSEWGASTLGDLAVIEMGQSPKGIECNSDGNGTPLLNGPTEFGSYHPYATQFTTDPKRFSKEDDLLFCVRGSTTGRMNWSDKNYAIGRGLAAFRHKAGSEYKSFLRGIIDSKLPELLSSATGSTFPNVSKKQLHDLEIRIPPLLEQKAIAHILGSLDDKIQLKRQMNETLESMAQALFKSWFVDFDPVIDNALAAGNPIPDVFAERSEQRRELNANAEISPKSGGVSSNDSENSHQSLFPSEFEFTEEMGWIPKGWGVEPLDNVCSNITDGSHTSPKSTDEGFPMSSVKDMNNWGISLDSCRRISEDDYLQLVKNNCKPLKNDVLIAKDGSYLKHIFVVEEELDLVILSSIAILRPNGRINSHFLSFTLKRKDVLKRMENYVSGAVIQRIVLRDFRKFEIVVPPTNLQELWFGLIGSGVEQCWNNNHMNNSLTKLRDTLLPKLLSGELRIPDAEKLIKEAGL